MFIEIINLTSANIYVDNTITSHKITIILYAFAKLDDETSKNVIFFTKIIYLYLVVNDYESLERILTIT